MNSAGNINFVNEQHYARRSQVYSQKMKKGSYYYQDHNFISEKFTRFPETNSVNKLVILTNLAQYVTRLLPFILTYLDLMIYII